MDETTEHPTLVEFLLERIAENEDAARYCLNLAAKYYPAEEGFTVTWDWSMHTSNVSGGYGSQFMRLEGFDPARVLAECEAKRRIVEMAEVAHERGIVSASPLFLALRYLAVPYADHPDYREEWRP